MAKAKLQLHDCKFLMESNEAKLEFPEEAKTFMGGVWIHILWNNINYEI